MAGNRPVRVPPPDLGKRDLPQTRQLARAWYRLHPAAFGAIFFSLNPTHRYSRPGCPCPILYVAIDPQTCLWERFGDYVFDNQHTLPKTQWDDAMFSTIDVPNLHICDLSKTATRGNLTVDLTALMNDDLDVPQQWGLGIQKHPSHVPAIKFKSRFTGNACLAIFDCGGIRTQLRETRLSPLTTFGTALDWLTRHEVILL
jgi:RES domain